MCVCVTSRLLHKASKLVNQRKAPTDFAWCFGKKTSHHQKEALQKGEAQ